MSDDFEELEQIPWAALAAGTSSPRNRYLGIAAAVVVLIAAGVWMLIRTDGATVRSIAASPTTFAPVPVDAPPVSTTSPVTTAAVYSEADLMLIDTTDEERLAVMHAEWLVRDFLTVDDDPQIIERIDDLLPDRRQSATPTYVEWSRAFSVEVIAPGLYRVEVGYRTLSGTADGYVRQPAGALAVQLAIDVGGAARLVAGPEPVAVPNLLGSPG